MANDCDSVLKSLLYAPPSCTIGSMWNVITVIYLVNPKLLFEGGAQAFEIVKIKSI